ncbi:MAG: alpha/beta hydrolase [Bacteroidota bacterium]
MVIRHLEKININNSEQWILVRGEAENTPLILHVQAGPGLPIIPEANTLEKLLRLEEKHLVAYWDQRACGKSFGKIPDESSMNLDQLADDVLENTKYLLNKYKKEKAVVVGYSIGATLSLMAATKNSNLFEHLFLVGIDVDIPYANEYALKFALKKANELNNSRLAKQANDLMNIPITNSTLFRKRAKLLTNAGGMNTKSSYNQLMKAAITNMILCKEYKLNDIIKTIKGMEYCQNTLLPEMNALNLFDRIKSVNVPVHFIQGKLDGISPYDKVVQFFEYLISPNKTFTAFNNSAHMPHYEEPEKFARMLKENY